MNAIMVLINSINLIRVALILRTASISMDNMDRRMKAMIKSATFQFTSAVYLLRTPTIPKIIRMPIINMDKRLVIRFLFKGIKKAPYKWSFETE